MVMQRATRLPLPGGDRQVGHAPGMTSNCWEQFDLPMIEVRGLDAVENSLPSHLLTQPSPPWGEGF